MRLAGKEAKKARLEALRKKANKFSIDRLVELSGVSRATVLKFRQGGSIQKETEKALAAVLNVKRKEALYVDGRDFVADPLSVLDAGDLHAACAGLGVDDLPARKAKVTRVSIEGMPLWCDEHWGCE